MNKVRRSLTVLAISGASIAAWFGVSALVDNVQYARAAQEVELSREQLQNIQDLSAVYRKVANVIGRSVVKIDVTKTIRASQNNLPFTPDQLRRFFPNLNPDDDQQLIPEQPDDDMQQQKVMGEGSGVIMEASNGNAYVLTNNHVAGGASDLKVTLSDGRVISDCKVVGADPKSDLAVVKISASNVFAARWGNSDELQQGDIILAFGSPFGYVGSMTHGIVSALNRTNVGILDPRTSYENFIQVDAPINPGNSGGPLVDLHGDVVGINTAIASNTGRFSGIGFAIPSNQAKTVYEQLKSKGKVVRGYLGAGINDVANAPELAKTLGFTGDKGVIISELMADAPASGELQSGDIVTAIDGKQVDNMTQLRNQVAGSPPGTELKLTIFRDHKQQDVTVKIGEQPDDLLARSSTKAPGKGESAPMSAENLGFRFTNPNDELLQRYSLSDGAKGALVTAVRAGSPAAMSGIRPGDLITRVGDTSVANASSASEALANQNVSAGVRLYLTNKDGDRLVFVKSSK